MKVYIWGEGEQSTLLKQKVQIALEELGLVEFIELEETSDTALAQDLQIQESPALIIEEESIDFRDMIFEGIIPDEEEIKAMFLSIIWWGSAGGACWKKDAGGGCGSGCSC